MPGPSPTVQREVISSTLKRVKRRRTGQVILMDLSILWIYGTNQPTTEESTFIRGAPECSAVQRSLSATISHAGNWQAAERKLWPQETICLKR